MLENKEKIDKNRFVAIDLNRLVSDIGNELSKRSRQVIIKRFNLDGEGIHTLSKIGEEYGITRERVRQVESESIKNLRRIGEKYDIDLVFDNVRKTIEDHGGLMSEKEITSYLFKDKNHDNISKQISLLILSLDDRIKVAKETDEYKRIYFYKKEDFEKFKKIITILEEYLIESKENLDLEKIAVLLESESFSSLSEKSIKSYLESNKIILQSVIGEWGHQEWPHINPKSIRDKAYLTLRKNEEHLHFVEIANGINEIWKSRKKANNQTVHNELIKDRRFVLVGRGIYALKEWGYKTGTVLDVLLEVFNTDSREMDQNKIVKRVLEKRKVKKNTIILNLQNKRYFEKLANKVYRLK